MQSLAKLTGWFNGHVSFERRVPEPEPINGKPREITGFFAYLTPEQQAKALAYRGPENHGDAKFLLRR
jgi:hypothetical protein